MRDCVWQNYNFIRNTQWPNFIGFWVRSFLSLAHRLYHRGYYHVMWWYDPFFTHSYTETYIHHVTGCSQATKKKTFTKSKWNVNGFGLLSFLIRISKQARAIHNNYIYWFLVSTLAKCFFYRLKWSTFYIRWSYVTLNQSEPRHNRSYIHQRWKSMWREFKSAFNTLLHTHSNYTCTDEIREREECGYLKQ